MPAVTLTCIVLASLVVGWLAALACKLWYDAGWSAGYRQAVDDATPATPAPYLTGTTGALDPFDPQAWTPTER